MKKILIASYYFPPCNVVSSGRIQSFADNFKRQGLYPIVVTRHWRGDERSTEGYESENLTPPSVTKTDDYTLIRLPYPAQLNRFYERPLLATRVTKLLLYTGRYAVGDINPKCNAHAAFYDYLVEYLTENQVDFILATAFPMNIIRLGSRLAKKFNIPFIADFRDLWDNNLLADDFKPSFVDRFQRFIYERHLRNWLKEARLVTSVSKPLVDEVRRLAPHSEAEIITNGFESDLFEGLGPGHRPRTDKFVFSVIGTLKPNQDLALMLSGLDLFLADKDPAEIELNFIGVGEFPEVKKMIEQSLPAECMRATERIPHDEAVKQMFGSHILFYAGWRGHRGIASGKIYEYLGARRNILIAPNDRDVLETLITETRAGKTADTPQEFAAALNGWFDQWKADGKIEYHGLDDKIGRYTREVQAEKLARAILALQ